MKLQFRLSLMVLIMVVAIIGGMAVILLRYASSMQMQATLQSQERLAAEQALIIKAQYEEPLQMANTLAGIMADYDSIEAGKQRNRFNQFIHSVMESEQNIVSIYAVFKPNTLDPGWEETFAGSPGNTESGQYASWYTREFGQIEHLTYGDIQTAMGIINGASARKPMIHDPVPQKVAGIETFIISMTMPIIHRKTNQVMGLLGVNVDTAQTQSLLIAAADEHNDIDGLAVYSQTGINIASNVQWHQGKSLRDAQGNLFLGDTEAAYNSVINGTQTRFTEYSLALDMNMELVLYPFTIGSFGTTWTLILGTEDAVMSERIRQMATFTFIIVAVTLLLIGGLIVMLVASISKPITELADTLKEVTEGDLNKDNFTNLTSDVDTTIEKVRDLVSAIKNQSIALAKTNHYLASNINETTILVNGDSAKTYSVKDQMINDSISLTETNTTVERFTNNNVDKQSGTSVHSSPTIDEMLSNIQSVSQIMLKNTGQVKDLMEATDPGAADLHEAASEIQELVNTPPNGETRKGLLLLADEIRKLAENANEQSEIISAGLEKIKGAIDKMNKAADSAPVMEAADQAANADAEQAQAIDSAMDEQSPPVNQVSSGSEELLEESKNPDMENHDNTQGMNEVTKEANQGSEFNDQDKENSDIRAQEVSKFKTE